MTNPSQKEINEFIIGLGKNPDATRDFLSKYPDAANANGSWGEGALYYVASRAIEDAFWLLVEHGADIHRIDGNGCTPLMGAVHHPQFAHIVKWLVEQGVDVQHAESGGSTALTQAVYWNGNERAVRLLLAAGADAWRKNADGNNAIDIARREGFDALIPTLKTLSKASVEAAIATVLQQGLPQPLPVRKLTLLRKQPGNQP